jgi:hypothetical protein
LGETGWIGCVRFEKINYKFFASTMARTAPGAGFARVLLTETETLKTHQTFILGETGWIGCVCFEKINMSFFASTVARTVLEGGFRMSFVNQNRNLEHTKHEFWVKRGGLCAFISKKSTASFFTSTVARTAL